MPTTKVLQVLEATVGGARKHVGQVLRRLLRTQRFEVHLACSLERDPTAAAWCDARAAEGVRVVPVRMLRRPAPLADVAALRHLTRLMRAERYDLVHTHAAKAGFLGRWAARRAGVPAVVHTPHTFPFERRDTPLAPLYRALERRAARWADRIVLVCESQRSMAEGAGIGPSERLVVIPNGIAPPAREPAALRGRFRAELGLEPGDVAVAFVGRLTPQKDIQTFLSAAARVGREVPAARFFVVGGTDSRRYLRSLRPPVSAEAWRVVTQGAAAGAHAEWSADLPVRVLGHRDDAVELVAAFDVVVLPSLYEGLPYSLLEAMAQGVATVASDVTGNRDAIEQGRSGLLVAPGDVGGFARAVAELCRDAELRARVGAAARERVAAEFTEEGSLARLVALYDELLAR